MIKSFTDIEQSKILAEILPPESADMHYCMHPLEGYYSPIPCVGQANKMHDEIPCWSLAALLCVLPKLVTLRGSAEDSYWYCECGIAPNTSFEDSDNPVDACYKEILKLHKHNLL